MTHTQPHDVRLGLVETKPSDDPNADRLSTAFGGRTVVRPISESRFGRRFLARDNRRDTDCIIWLFDRVPPSEGPAVWAYLKRNAGARRPHVLAIDAVGRDSAGCWAVTPYVGNQAGVVTLAGLRAARGGSMSLFETGRAIEQLLDASMSAHAEDKAHGPIDPECVLVNPRGTLEIGMYGLAARLGAEKAPEDLVCEEIRSIGLIAERLLLGDAGDESHAPEPSRTGSALRAWIRRACDPIDGFDSAREAIAALPGKHDDAMETKFLAARSLLGRLSSAVSGTRGPRGRVVAGRSKYERPRGSEGFSDTV